MMLQPSTFNMVTGSVTTVSYVLQLSRNIRLCFVLRLPWSLPSSSFDKRIRVKLWMGGGVATSMALVEICKVWKLVVIMTAPPPPPMMA
jgi:hypothetical protein